MTAKITFPDENDLIQRYLSGESAIDIANSLGCSAVPVYRVLRERGAIRSMKSASQARWSRQDERVKTSAANVRVWQNRTDAERAAQLASAHAAARGRKADMEERCRRALSREGRLDSRSSLEPLFFSAMRDRGVIFDGMQTAIGPYNADFTIGRIAVEVRGRGFDDDFRSRFENRMRYFLDAGWSVLWFIFTDRHWVMTPDVADYIASHIQEACSNPPSPCEYRMIWGAGEFISTRCSDDNDLSLVMPLTSARDPANGRYQSIANKT